MVPCHLTRRLAPMRRAVRPLGHNVPETKGTPLMLITEVERRYKAFSPALFKAAGEVDPDGTKLEPGEFVALAAVFGNVDSYGDRMVKGAFADTLAAWEAKGDPIPVIWSHNWADPFAHIGHVLWARETDEGLLYKGRLDIDVNPFAAQVHGLMKGRRITQQSFGFDVLDAREIVEDNKGIFEITKVDLWEVGPCLVGVNQATDLRDIKSRSALAGGPPPAEGEPSGQAKATAAGASSSTPGSDPEAPASKGMSPASVMLATEIILMEDYE